LAGTISGRESPHWPGQKKVWQKGKNGQNHTHPPSCHVFGTRNQITILATPGVPKVKRKYTKKIKEPMPPKPEKTKTSKLKRRKNESDKDFWQRDAESVAEQKAKQKEKLAAEHTRHHLVKIAVEALGLKREKRDTISQLHLSIGKSILTNWRQFLVSAVPDNLSRYIRYRYDVDKRSSQRLATKLLKPALERFKESVKNTKEDDEDTVELPETDCGDNDAEESDEEEPVDEDQDEKQKRCMRLQTASLELQALLGGIEITQVAIVLGKEVARYNLQFTDEKDKKKCLKLIPIFPQRKFQMQYIRVDKQAFWTLLTGCWKTEKHPEVDYKDVFGIFLRACCPHRQLQR
jgi:hypothetical protein